MPMSEKEKFNSNKYKATFARENYDRLAIQLPKGEKATVKAYAAEHGLSLNAFVAAAIREKMQ